MELFFTQQALNYNYGDLLPFIDATTVDTHYNKHHKGYLNKLNLALTQLGSPKGIRLQEIFSQINTYSAAIRNNAGGHYNHQLFWKILTPANQQNDPDPILKQAIAKRFGNLAHFMKAFHTACMERFGSGWGWLIVDTQGILQICTTPNQDNPLMRDALINGTPILSLDLWEHAYYLHYKNDRSAYINAFWQCVCWKEVNTRFQNAINGTL